MILASDISMSRNIKLKKRKSTSNWLRWHATWITQYISTTRSTVMNKSLRPLCKSDDFQHLTCNCIRHILLLRYKFVFFVVLHFVPILILCTFSGRFFCYLLIFLMPEMDKKKSPSEVQKTQIVALPGQNLSKRQISAQNRSASRCSKTAVHQAMAKYQQDGSCID